MVEEKQNYRALSIAEFKKAVQFMNLARKAYRRARVLRARACKQRIKRVRKKCPRKAVKKLKSPEVNLLDDVFSGLDQL